MVAYTPGIFQTAQVFDKYTVAPNALLQVEIFFI